MPQKQKNEIKILIADPHPVVREGLKAQLSTQPAIKVIGEATDGEEAVCRSQKLGPDVVIMGFDLPKMNGLQVTRLLRQKAPQAQVLIFAATHSSHCIREAFLCGARGFVAKTASVRQVVQAVKAVCRGRLVFPPEAIPPLAQETSGKRKKPGRLELTPREKEVLVLIARGRANKEIARALFLSIRTIETHRQHLMGKLNIHNVAGLTHYAIAQGFIPVS